MIEENLKLTNFSFVSHKNKLIDFKKLKKKYLIIYIYPKNFTPGCTLEAQDFVKEYKKFKKKNCEIIGISADNKDSHIKFVKKNKIPFNLISDEKKKIIKKLGAFGKKNMYGKNFYGIKRTTILINKSRKIIKIWKNVKVKNHINNILKFLETNR